MRTKIMLLTVALFSSLFFSVAAANAQTTPACAAQISLDVSPRSVSNLKPDVTVSGWVKPTADASGTCMAGGALVRNFILTFTDGRNRSIQSEFISLSAQKNFSFIVTPAKGGYAPGDTFVVNAKVSANPADGRSAIPLTAAAPVSVEVMKANQIFGCLAPNGIYACSPDRNSSQLSDSVCGDNPVLPVDSSFCGHGVSMKACTDTGVYKCINPSDTIAQCKNGLKDVTSDQCDKPVSGAAPQEDTGPKQYGLVGKFIPGCVNETDGKAFLKSDCADITIFFDLMFNIINYLFGIIGGVALLFFVYGGFMFILSQGNAEKIEQGKSIIVAAVLGIIIAFSGYAIVKFVGTAVGIKSEYQLK